MTSAWICLHPPPPHLLLDWQDTLAFYQSVSLTLPSSSLSKSLGLTLHGLLFLFLFLKVIFIDMKFT